MSLVIFVLLAILAAVVIAYPLLRPGLPAQPEVSMSDAQIERAVQRLRQAGKRGEAAELVPGALCPACGTPYQPDDRFCVRCGQTLPRQEAVYTPAHGALCPSCGAGLRADDVFCARCGHRLRAPGEAGGLEEVQP